MTASNLLIKTAAAVAIVASFGVAQAQTSQSGSTSPGVNQNRVQPELNSNRGAVANTPGTTGGSTMGTTGSSNMGTTGSTGSMGTTGSSNMGTTGSGNMGTSDSMRMGNERNMRSDRN